MGRSYSCVAEDLGLLGRDAAYEGGRSFETSGTSNPTTQSHPSRLESPSNTYLTLRSKVLVDKQPGKKFLDFYVTRIFIFLLTRHLTIVG